jgi:hypothetical protein
MDTTWNSPLEQARAFVASAERRIRAQEDLITRITARGGNAAWAIEVLETFQSTLKLMQLHLTDQEEEALQPD